MEACWACRHVSILSVLGISCTSILLVSVCGAVAEDPSRHRLPEVSHIMLLMQTRREKKRKSNQVKSNLNKTNQIKSNQIKSNQIKSNQMNRTEQNQIEQNRKGKTIPFNANLMRSQVLQQAAQGLLMHWHVHRHAKCNHRFSHPSRFANQAIILKQIHIC